MEHGGKPRKMFFESQKAVMNKIANQQIGIDLKHEGYLSDAGVNLKVYKVADPAKVLAIHYFEHPERGNWEKTEIRVGNNKAAIRIKSNHTESPMFEYRGISQIRVIGIKDHAERLNGILNESYQSVTCLEKKLNLLSGMYTDLGFGFDNLHRLLEISLEKILAPYKAIELEKMLALNPPVGA